MVPTPKSACGSTLLLETNRRSLACRTYDSSFSSRGLPVPKLTLKGFKLLEEYAYHEAYR